jgi:tetratricopeptide (TPR) repeat protein
MSRSSRIILAVVAVLATVPGTLWAQRPSNNVHTRSAALYLSRAREQPNPEEKRALYQQALEAALEGTQRTPTNPRVWLLAGQAAIRLDDYVRADSLLTRAETIYPGYEEVRVERENAWITAFNAGVTALQQERTDEALEHLVRADLIYDGRPEASLNLGAVYHRLGRPDDAVESFRQALVILRGPALAAQTPAAAANWREWEEVAAFNLAQILATAGRDAEAIAAYRDFLEREPDNVTAQVNLAVVLTRHGAADEASEMYARLLDRTELSEQDFATIGIGLFRAQRYPEAARAFRRQAELNAYNRDAFYNLAQALYLVTGPLEERYKAAAGAAQAAIRAELQPIYEEMAAAAGKTIEFDPFNQNAHRLQAQAYRGIADLETGAAATQWRNRALAVLEQSQALGFTVEDIATTAADDHVRMSGRVRNVRAAAGQPIRFRVLLLSASGQVLGTQDVEVAAPAVEQHADFEVQIPVAEAVGWRMERIG